MYEEHKIVLKNNIYWVRFELDYKIVENRMQLMLKNFTPNNYEVSQIRRYCTFVEKNFSDKIDKKFTKKSYDLYEMGQILYIYLYLPCLSSITYETSDEKVIYTKDFIERFVKENDIELTNQYPSSIYDESTWVSMNN